VSQEISKGRAERGGKIEQIKGFFSKVEGGVLTDFRGLKVSQITDLRRRFRAQKVAYRVLKNTLVKIAVRGTPLEDLAKMLEGPTGIAFGSDDPIAPARVAMAFAKDNDALKIKGGFLDGLILSVPEVAMVSKLGGKNQMRAQLLSAFNAPAQQFLAVLNAVPQQLLGVLDARARQIEKPAA
jgi:large subunit ribosomal protein L10